MYQTAKQVQNNQTWEKNLFPAHAIPVSNWYLPNLVLKIFDLRLPIPSLFLATISHLKCEKEILCTCHCIWLCLPNVFTTSHVAQLTVANCLSSFDESFWNNTFCNFHETTQNTKMKKLVTNCFLALQFGFFFGHDNNSSYSLHFMNTSKSGHFLLMVENKGPLLLQKRFVWVHSTFPPVKCLLWTHGTWQFSAIF